MDHESRAKDLVERLKLTGLHGGINAIDLYSKDARDGFRALCVRLANCLQKELPQLGLCDTSKLSAAVQAVHTACEAQRSAQGNRLDDALTALLRATDGGSPAAPERLEVLERLVAVLQAARLLRLRAREEGEQEGQPQAQPQHPQASAAAPVTPPAASAAAAAAAAALPGKQTEPVGLVSTAGGAAGAVESRESKAAGACAALQANAGEVSHTLRLVAKAMQVPPQQQPSASAGTGGGGRLAALPLLAALVPRVEAALRALGPGFLQPMCSRAGLGAQELATLAEIHGALAEEYGLRRAVLIERAKVTLQAFEWSPRLKEKGTAEEAAAVAEQAKRAMRAQPQVQLEDVWSLRPADVVALVAAPTSTGVAALEVDVLAGVGTAGAGATRGSAGAGASRQQPALGGAGIKAVLIGSVPDRGGRPDGRAREAGMPEFRPRSAAAAGGGVGRGAGGGRGGSGGAGRGGGQGRSRGAGGGGAGGGGKEGAGGGAGGETGGVERVQGGWQRQGGAAGGDGGGRGGAVGGDGGGRSGAVGVDGGGRGGGRGGGSGGGGRGGGWGHGGKGGGRGK